MIKIHILILAKFLSLRKRKRIRRRNHIYICQIPIVLGMTKTFSSIGIDVPNE
jgi:hypothetical protein